MYAYTGEKTEDIPQEYPIAYFTSGNCCVVGNLCIWKPFPDHQYHTEGYITDASGDGRVVEYDCESESRKMIVTPVRSVTNFFEIYKDKVLPYQRNGIYGHGKERYDMMEAIFDDIDSYSIDTAWDALKAASQEPSAEDITSNTQWSVIYNDTKLTAEIVLRRKWADVIGYSLQGNRIKS